MASDAKKTPVGAKIAPRIDGRLRRGEILTRERAK
jgi:hypothetical protein